MFGHKFPYTNFHEMNLDWLMERIAWIEDKLSRTFDIPLASKTKWGRARIGDNINVEEGTISVAKARPDRLGLVRVGNNLTIDEDGVLNAIGGETTDVEVLTYYDTGTKLADIKVNQTRHQIYMPPIQIPDSGYTPYQSGDEPVTDIWIDHAYGDDVTGDGTNEKPFKTLAHFINIDMQNRAHGFHKYNVQLKCFNGDYIEEVSDAYIDYDINLNFTAYSFSSTAYNDIRMTNCTIAGTLTCGYLPGRGGSTSISDNIQHRLKLFNSTIAPTGKLIYGAGQANTWNANNAEFNGVDNYGALFISGGAESSRYVYSSNSILIGNKSIKLYRNSKLYIGGCYIYMVSTKITSQANGTGCNVPYIEMSAVDSNTGIIKGNAIIMTNDCTANATTFDSHTAYTLK